MRYLILHPKPRKPSMVITRDEKVVWTTAALWFWVGQRFDVAMANYAAHCPEAQWRLVGTECDPPPKGKEPTWP